MLDCPGRVCNIEHPQRKEAGQNKALQRRLPAMLSAAEIAKIKADIAWLKKCRDRSVDSGIRQLIEDWIAELKEKLASDRSDA